MENFDCTSPFTHKVFKIMKQQIISYLVRFRRGLAAFCAGLAALIMFNTLTAEEIKTNSVLRMKHTVAAGSILSANDFEIGKLPVHLTWPGVLQSPDQATGKSTSHSMTTGEPISASDLLGANMLSGFPAGTVAMALTNLSEASAQSVRIGDHVDIYATEQSADSMTIRVAHNVIVVSQTSFENSLTSNVAKGALMVAVNSAQAQVIAENMGRSTLNLALLNRG